MTSRGTQPFHEYSKTYGKDENGETSEVPPDGGLVLTMISTAVVSRFCKMLECGGFNPYCGRDVKRIIDDAQQLAASIGSGHIRIMMTLKSVHSIFGNATILVGTLLSLFPRSNRPKFDPEAIATHNRPH